MKNSGIVAKCAHDHNGQALLEGWYEDWIWQYATMQQNKVLTFCALGGAEEVFLK
jgi:hypothetical protein